MIKIIRVTALPDMKTTWFQDYQIIYNNFNMMFIRRIEQVLIILNTPLSFNIYAPKIMKPINKKLFLCLLLAVLSACSKPECSDIDIMLAVTPRSHQDFKPKTQDELLMERMYAVREMLDHGCPDTLKPKEGGAFFIEPFFLGTRHE